MRYLIVGAVGVLAGFAAHRLSQYENPGSMDAILEAAAYSERMYRARRAG